MNAHVVILYVLAAIAVLVILLGLVKAVKTNSWTPFFLKIIAVFFAFYFVLMIVWLAIPDGTTWP